MGRFHTTPAWSRRAWIPALTVLLLTAWLAGPGGGAAQAQLARPGAPAAPVEPQLRDQLAAQGEATFWVVLDQQADLTAAAEVSDWDARGAQVYTALTSTADQTQAGLRALLADRGAGFRPFWIVNAIQVSGDAALVDELAGRPEVAEIRAERSYQIPTPRPALTTPPEVDAVEWGIDRIRAPQVWDTYGARGEGIVVGLIDTGVLFDHPALVAQYRGNQGDGTFDHNYNWHDPSEVCGSPSLVPCDNHGHGSHVTGTMVGDDGGANQIGVAPQARWIAAKGCETDECSDAALLSSGEFMVAPTDLAGLNPRPDLRPHIVNNSWGGDPDADPWYQGIVQAWVAAGIFPQFSGGNEGPGCGTAGNPGNQTGSYAAGAFDINNNIAGFSSRGPSAFGGIVKPNLAAPGVAVRSSWNDATYRSISGTSMASPHVAGSVALMWSAAPEWARDIPATRSLLDQTAIDVENLQCGGTPENNHVWGEGRLDAFAAVSAALGVTVPPVIEVTPDSLAAEQPAGTVTEQPLTIDNTGEGPLDWSIEEAEAGTGSRGGDPNRTVPRELPDRGELGQTAPAGNVIQDGSFEAGSPNPFWDEGSTNFGTPLCTELSCGTGNGSGPNNGDWWTWFGGIDAPETGFVRQDVTIAPGVAELRFWLEIPAASGTGQDSLTVSVDGIVVFEVTDADAASFPTYTEMVVFLNSFADGGTHTLSFDSTVFGGGTTNFFVDDVVLDTQGPAGPCDTPSDVPWLGVSAASGSTDPGGSSDVTVAFDSTGLAPGTFEALLCVTSNDPATPLVRVPVSLTVTGAGAVCDQTISGVHHGPLTVTEGTTCLAAGSQVLGEVNVSGGAGLVATAAVIQGPLSAVGATVVDLAFTQVTGPVLVLGATGRVSVFGSQVTGPVSLLNGTTGDPTTASGNTIIGTLSCFANQPAPTDHGLPNTATGGKLGQCADL